MKKYQLIISLVMGCMLLLMFSCRKKNQEKDSVNLVDISNLNTEEVTSIDTLYIIQRNILDTTPKVLADNQNNQRLISSFESSTQFEVKDELEKYLQRKKVYDKSEIFDGVP